MKGKVSQLVSQSTMDYCLGNIPLIGSTGWYRFVILLGKVSLEGKGFPGRERFPWKGKISLVGKVALVGKGYPGRDRFP